MFIALCTLTVMSLAVGVQFSMVTGSLKFSFGGGGAGDVCVLFLYFGSNCQGNSL